MITEIKNFFLQFYTLPAYSHRMLEVQMAAYTQSMQATAHYKSKKRLLHYEHKAYSQNGEDGIIREIFNRIGYTNRNFVEIGASNGKENNTAFLLSQGWSGIWIDGSKKNCVQAKQLFSLLVDEKKLDILQAYVDKDNIEDLLRSHRVSSGLDLLSIDIDGNDYWIWKEITHFRPRVVVIEYNAFFPADMQWIMPYNKPHLWDGSVNHGASLKSLEKLGKQKGYYLVGCDFAGINAFFVRKELCKNLFEDPYTSENHYEHNKPFMIDFQIHSYPGFVR